MTIKSYREDKGLTQGQLAETVGLTQQAIAKWESGASAPRAELLPKLAAILGCTVDELLKEEE